MVMFHVQLAQASSSRAVQAQEELDIHFLTLFPSAVLMALGTRVSASNLTSVVLVVTYGDIEWHIVPITLTALVSWDSHLEHQVVQVLTEGPVQLPMAVEDLDIDLEVVAVAQEATDLHDRLVEQLIMPEFTTLQVRRHKPPVTPYTIF